MERGRNSRAGGAIQSEQSSPRLSQQQPNSQLSQRNVNHGNEPQNWQSRPSQSAQASPRRPSYGNQAQNWQQRTSQSANPSLRDQNDRNQAENQQQRRDSNDGQYRGRAQYQQQRPERYDNQFQIPPNASYSGGPEPRRASSPQLGSGQRSRPGSRRGSQAGSRRNSYTYQEAPNYRQQSQFAPGPSAAPVTQNDSDPYSGTTFDEISFPALSASNIPRRSTYRQSTSDSASASTSATQLDREIASGSSRSIVRTGSAFGGAALYTPGADGNDPSSASGIGEGQPGDATSHFGEREEFNPAMHAPFQGQLHASREADAAEQSWLHFISIRCKNVLRISRDNSVEHELRAIADEMRRYQQSFRGRASILPQRPAVATRMRPVDHKIFSNFIALHVQNANTGHQSPPPARFLDPPTIHREFIMYTLSWSPGRGLFKRDRQTLWENYVRSNGNDDNTLNNIFVVYDGNALVVAEQELAYSNQDLRSAEGVQIHSSTNEGRRYEGTLRFRAAVDFNDVFTFIRRPQQECAFPANVISTLNLIVKQFPILKQWIESGRYFFAADGRRGLNNENDILQFMSGYFQSVRALAGGLMVNVDVMNGIFYAPNVKLSEAWSRMVRYHLPENKKRPFNNYNLRDGHRIPMNGEQVALVKECWKGLAITSHHRSPGDRDGRHEPPLNYNICDISFEAASHHRVSDRFRRGWEGPRPLTEFISQEYPEAPRDLEAHLPAIRISKNMDFYLPWGCCTTGEASRFSLKVEKCRNPDIISPKPSIRLGGIEEYVRQRQNVNNDQHAVQHAIQVERGFGVELDSKLVTLDGHILSHPNLHGSQSAQVRMDNRGNYELLQHANFRYARGVTIDRWGLLCLWSGSQGASQDDVNWNLFELLRHAEQKGMRWARNHVCSTTIVKCNDRSQSPTQKRNKLRSGLRDLMGAAVHGAPLQLILCVMDQKMNPWYATLKYICDRELGVQTQVMIVKLPNTNPDPHNFQNRRPAMYFVNLTLKVNVKCGGQNFIFSPQSLREMPLLGESMLLGADVTHPTDSDPTSPSIAAVVASVDPSAVQYACRIRAQQGKRECIAGLQYMVEELLQVYREKSGRLPSNILFFRDGVSETQFLTTLRYEGIAIMDACQHLRRGYQPKLFIILAVKRHHTRFFIKIFDARGNCSGVLNLSSGTVIDSVVTHPREFEFYLCSQSPSQGTSRLTKYHVLLDQLEIHPDDLYRLVFNLCHMFQRSNKPVALASPVFYAHLAAFRAKQYMEHYLGEYRAQNLERRSMQQRGERWTGIPMAAPLDADYNAHPSLWNHLWYL